MNPIKSYVEDGDVLTEVKRLINLGQKEGYILFAGTTNTGMPSSHPTGTIHYVQYSGSSVIYLTYRYNYDIYYGRMGSTDTVPTWARYILGTDLVTGVAWCSYPTTDTWFEVSVNYGKTFNSAPKVFLQVAEQGRAIHANVYKITTTGCIVKFKSDVVGNSNVYWLAIA